MLQLFYIVIFIEMFMILTFIFKTSLRKFVIIFLDRFKRGHGPIVVYTLGATLMVVLSSRLYSMTAILNPTGQVLMFKSMLEVSLMGFLLFLYMMIDRLHHCMRELPLLRKTMEVIKKQNRSFEDDKSGNTLKSKIEKLESECKAKRNEAKTLETEVEALKKQSGALKKQSETLKKQLKDFLKEYDRLFKVNQS